MWPKTLLAFFFSLFIISETFAEAGKTSVVKGTALNSVTSAPLYDIKVSITSINVSVVTNGEGVFTISEVPYGDYIVTFSGSTIAPYSMNISVDKDVVEIGNVYIAPSEKAQPTDNTEIPSITTEDNNANQDDDASSVQGSSGMFMAGHDPFLSAMTYTFGQYYFKPRGATNNEVQVNGIAIDDLERGFSNWAQLGGLNDVLHGRNITYGLWPSGYAYGGNTGTTYIDATAADQRKGNTVTYTNYNRNYRNRLMYTHSSGLMKNGWAWSVSGSRRWAEEGYTPGTFYDGYSFYGAASKVVRKSQFNFTAIAAPTKRGRAANTTQETYDITGDNQYNPAWGYQNGEKRNARVVETFQPLFIANYTYRPTSATRWNTALGFETGKYKSSTLDYFNAYSPRPNYYRNLPSYYYTDVPAWPGIAQAVNTQLTAHPDQLQIDWNGMYEANYMNYETIKSVNGIADNNVTGKRSIYVLSDYVNDMKKLSFNSNVEHAANEHLTLAGGVRVIAQQNENYRQLADLLGGDFFLNTYQFLNSKYTGDRDFAQNDLNNPNKLVKKGDKYGYDYILRNTQAEGWAQAALVYNKADLFIAGNAGNTSFSREGMMRNGLFANNSFGKSETHNFLTYKMKGGIMLKASLHHAIYANADYSAEAPLMSNTYISAGTRDFVINNPTTVKTKTAEAGYIVKTHDFTGRITGYVSDVYDNTIIKRFFYDELGISSFISYVMNKVSTRSTGIEFAASYKFTPIWSVTGVAAIGQYFYTNSPMVNIYLDNDPTITSTAHKVYISDYYAGQGPQSVYSLAVNCRPGRWNASVSFNYMNRNYIDIYPERRTASALDLIPLDSKAWKAIVDQERMPAAFTTDLYLSRGFNTPGISKRLHRDHTSIFVGLGINNLFNKKDIRLAGMEQLRYDFTNRSADKFGNFYDYAFGINYSANINFRF